MCARSRKYSFVVPRGRYPGGPVQRARAARSARTPSGRQGSGPTGLVTGEGRAPARPAGRSPPPAGAAVRSGTGPAPVTPAPLPELGDFLEDVPTADRRNRAVRVIATAHLRPLVPSRSTH
ncbi:hypothetical protein GCM10027174_33790 [Salinifilum aidingensis]